LVYLPEPILALVTSRSLPAKFYKYKEILVIIRMPGEIGYSLWIANESAFKKTEKHMQQGKGQD